MVKRIFAFLKSHSKRWWYLPVICLLTFIDLFIVLIPTEAMIITTSVMLPKRWFLTAVSITTSSALGALVMTVLTQHYGDSFISWVAGNDIHHSAIWLKITHWIEQYGFWGIWFTAIGPLPQQPAILIGAIAHMTPLSIFWAVWLGRIPKYLFFSYLATKGEKWIREKFVVREGSKKLSWLRDALLKFVHESNE